MIRPITCLTFLLACGSGLYLYQSKHRVELLDRQIEQIAADTDQVRQQTRMLRAEWTLLNDPARLRQLAAQFLDLKTVSPGQFTNLAELDARLPPVGSSPSSSQPEVIPIEPAPSVPAPVASTTPNQTRMASAELHPPLGAAGANQHDQTAQQPAPPIATAQSRVTPAVRAATQSTAEPPPTMHGSEATLSPGETRDQHRIAGRAIEQHRIALARSTGVSRSGTDQPRPPEERPTQHAAEPRRAKEAHPVVATTRIPPPSLPAGGSLLGMARGGVAPPAPLPLPRPGPASGPVYMNGG